MKTSRAAMVAGASATVLVTGWSVSPKAEPTLDLVQAEGASVAVSPSVSPVPLGATTTAGASAAPTPSPTDATVTPTTVAAPVEAPPPAPVSQTFTGPAISNEKGTFQAQITVADGVVTVVAAVQAGTQARESRQVNANAIPILAARVISAQSANVEYVSGASYTSPGFLQSVQGALGDAGLG